MDNCIKIWRDCLPELKEFMFPSNNESRRAGGSFRDDSPDMDLRFLVHDSQVGAIIGKAGVNVKNLRLQYQLNIIKVFPVTAPFSSDRLVQMVGKFDKVFDCFRVIYDILEGQVIKGLVENYNSANFDENLTLGYGGWSNPSSGFDNARKTGPGLAGGPGGDRNAPQSSRFNNTSNTNSISSNNNNNRSNEQFFPKSEMNRNNSMPKSMNRFENFNEPAPGFEMENDINFQMQFNSKPPSMAAAEQSFPGIMRKRNNNSTNMDIEPENVKRGRIGMMNMDAEPENSKWGRKPMPNMDAEPETSKWGRKPMPNMEAEPENSKWGRKPLTNMDVEPENSKWGRKPMPNMDAEPETSKWGRKPMPNMDAESENSKWGRKPMPNMDAEPENSKWGRKPMSNMDAEMENVKWGRKPMPNMDVEPENVKWGRKPMPNMDVEPENIKWGRKPMPNMDVEPENIKWSRKPMPNMDAEPENVKWGRMGGMGNRDVEPENPKWGGRMGGMGNMDVEPENPKWGRMGGMSNMDIESENVNWGRKAMNNMDVEPENPKWGRMGMTNMDMEPENAKWGRMGMANIDMEPENAKWGQMGMTNMDMEPENSKWGRMGMNNPNTFEPRNDKIMNPYDNRNEKPNFYDSKMSAQPYRNEQSINNPMMNIPPNINNFSTGNIMNNPSSTEKIDVSVPTTLIHGAKGLIGGDALLSIINDSGAEIYITASDEHDLETIVSLTGTKDQIEGAQYLLQICIKKSVLNL